MGIGLFGKKKDEETTLKEIGNTVVKDLIKSAEYSYKTTKYKRNIDQIELLKDWFTDLSNLITQKVNDRQYSAIKEIDVDLKNYINKSIVPTLHNIGYKTLIINKGTEIKHLDGSVDKIDTDSTFIIVMWNSPVLSDGTTTENNTIDKDNQQAINISGIFDETKRNEMLADKAENDVA